MVGDQAADQDPGPHALALGGYHLEHDAAVVHEDLLSRPDVGGQARVGGGGLRRITGHVLAGDGELTALRQLDGTGRERAETDLGTLQVDQHADTAARLV